MNALWEFYINYDPAMRTFVGIGAVSSIVLFIQMIVILIGGSDLDFDLGEVGEGGATGIFSIRSIGSFFTGFGWTGAMFLQNHHSVGVATLAATLVGSLILVGFLSLMRWLHGFKTDGTVNYENAVGNVGTVYIPIPPKRKGMGQIQVDVQGRISTVDAVSDSEEKIENRTPVRVESLVDKRTLLVKTLEEEASKEKELSPT